MTAKDTDGNGIFKDSKTYMPQATSCRDQKMIYGAHKKVGYIRDTSLQPFKQKDESFEITLPDGVRTVDVTVKLTYQPWPGNKYAIQEVTRTVTLDK